MIYIPIEGINTSRMRKKDIKRLEKLSTDGRVSGLDVLEILGMHQMLANCDTVEELYPLSHQLSLEFLGRIRDKLTPEGEEGFQLLERFYEGEASLEELEDGKSSLYRFSMEGGGSDAERAVLVLMIGESYTKSCFIASAVGALCFCASENHSAEETWQRERLKEMLT